MTQAHAGHVQAGKWEPSIGQAAPTPTEATASGGGGMAGPAVPRSTSPADGPEAPPSTPAPSAVNDAPAGRVVAVVVPLALTSGGNRREHHLARARRTRREHQTILAALAGYSSPALPVVVQLVRVGWNRLDVDGLVASVKGPIDAVARWLGVDDRDPRLRWHLAQSITRERRISRRTGRPEAAAELRIVVRRWEPSDGDDPLRVLAMAPVVQVQP